MSKQNELLPEWVEKNIKKAVVNKEECSITINFKNGGVRNLKVLEVKHPPKRITSIKK